MEQREQAPEALHNASATNNVVLIYNYISQWLLVPRGHLALIVCSELTKTCWLFLIRMFSELSKARRASMASSASTRRQCKPCHNTVVDVARRDPCRPLHLAYHQHLSLG